MKNIGAINVKRFRLSSLPRVVEILRDADEFRGLTNSNIKRTLYLRFGYGKWINRIERCLKNGSLKFLFTDAYDLTAFVAEEAKNGVVGVIIAYPTTDEVWLLHQIVVLPNYRKRRVGSQLLKKLISHVKSKGGKKIQLYVQPDNLGAKKLYTKLGFTVTSQPILMTMDFKDTQ